MKSHFNLLFAVLLLTIAVMSCEQDKPLVLEGVGLWNVTNQTCARYENGAKVEMEPQRNPAVQWNFERSGRGYIIYQNAEQDTVIWEECPDLDQLNIYNDGPFICGKVIARTANTLTLTWQSEADEWQNHIYIENAVTLERVIQEDN